MTRWNVAIEVEASPKAAARLRALLPEFLHQAGYTTTSGTRTVEVAFLAATENLKRQPADSEITRGAEDWMPRGKRHRKMGRGPVG